MTGRAKQEQGYTYVNRNKPQVFIVGSKGIPAKYGGFETFVDRLTLYSGDRVCYHVSCLSDKKGEYIYHGARCVRIPVPDIGPAKAIYYDCAALNSFISYCDAHPEIQRPIFYILTCRIGFAIAYFRRRIHQLGGVLYVNPDGQEWKRKKWSLPVRRYWKYSEGRMVRSADRIICDSQAIAAYIQKEYSRKQTIYLAYGAEKTTPVTPERVTSWLSAHGLSRENYYVLVGRFVPENNFEWIIRSFMASKTERKLAIITGENPKLLKKIYKRTGCQRDPRICFVGTLYEPGLLCAIRENAYASFHGHEVGGTNPSLLEAMRCTKVNLVLDVVFNREVGGQDAVLYWAKQAGSLEDQIRQAEQMTPAQREQLGEKAVLRICTAYRWEQIAAAYASLFEEELR